EDGIRDDLVTGVQTCALPIFFLSASHRLIQGEVNLVRLINCSFRNLSHRLTERLEVVNLRLVSEDISINQKKNPLLHSRFPKSRSEERRVGTGDKCWCTTMC